MTPDLGREAVYAAEIAAFEGTSYEVVTALEQLIELAALDGRKALGGQDVFSLITL